MISAFLVLLFSPIIIGLTIFGKLVKVRFWGENGSIINSRVFKTKSKFLRDIPLLFDVFIGQLSIVWISVNWEFGNNINDQLNVGNIFWKSSKKHFARQFRQRNPI